MVFISRKREKYEAFLENVPVFSNLNPGEKSQIADTLMTLKFNDGDVVIKFV